MASFQELDQLLAATDAIRHETSVWLNWGQQGFKGGEKQMGVVIVKNSENIIALASILKKVLIEIGARPLPPRVKDDSDGTMTFEIPIRPEDRPDKKD